MEMKALKPWLTPEQQIEHLEAGGVHIRGGLAVWLTTCDRGTTEGTRVP